MPGDRGLADRERAGKLGCGQRLVSQQLEHLPAGRTTDRVEEIYPVDAPLIRISIAPTQDNGLDRPSSLMVDKVTTVPRSGLVERLGRLRGEELIQLNRSLMVFLGLASVSQL